VVDVWVGVVRNAWESEGITKNIQAPVDKARKAVVPVI